MKKQLTMDIKCFWFVFILILDCPTPRGQGSSFLDFSVHRYLESPGVVIESYGDISLDFCALHCSYTAGCVAGNYNTTTSQCELLGDLGGEPMLTCAEGWNYFSMDKLPVKYIGHPCSSHPCNHGSCTLDCSDPRGYVCACDGGFSGDNCNQSCTDRLNEGEYVHANKIGHSDRICSSNGQYQAIMQTDGDFVVYRISGDEKWRLWSTQTKDDETVNFVVQADGNLVTYKADSTPTFNIEQGGSKFSPKYMMLSNDGRLLYYDTDDLLRWSSETCNWDYGNPSLGKCIPNYNLGGYPFGSHNERPARSCKAILDIGASRGSGEYYIQPQGEDGWSRTYCDMDFDGGGWTLAAYGYSASVSCHSSNRHFLPLGKTDGYNFKPTVRASDHGVIDLSHGATFLARDATEMLMAAGGNPTTGGANEYSFIFKIDISEKVNPITFANHGTYDKGKYMHMQKYTVQAMKGESGSATRYSYAESFGVSWTNTNPSGYGFRENAGEVGQGLNWDYGPFFPSVHSSDGYSGGCSCNPCQNWGNDVWGSYTYGHRGWYSMNANGRTGAMSIWFR